MHTITVTESTVTIVGSTFTTTVSLLNGSLIQSGTKSETSAKSEIPAPEEQPRGIQSMAVTPRWTVFVGDTVQANAKPNGRFFTTKVNSLGRDQSGKFAVVTNPRTGGVHTLSLDRLKRVK